MSNPNHYAHEAQLCRQEGARRAVDSPARQMWLKLAREYEKLAEQSAALGGVAAPPGEDNPADNPRPRDRGVSSGV